jgi:hypothetical protein
VRGDLANGVAFMESMRERDWVSFDSARHSSVAPKNPTLSQYVELTLSQYLCIFPNCSCWSGLLLMPMISQINSPSDKWGSGDTTLYTSSATNDTQIPEVVEPTDSHQICLSAW